MQKTENKIDYDFKTVAPDSYELVISMRASHGLFNQVLAATVNRLKAQGFPHPKDRFIVEPKFHNLLHTALKSTLKKIFADVKKDSIVILSDSVSFAEFAKKKDGWDIKIKVGGLCDRSRWGK